jgi:DNA-directed RNA polymerase subunit RPC12/RpoP
VKFKNSVLEVTEDGRCPYCGEKIELCGPRENKRRRGTGLFLRYLIPGRRSSRERRSLK